MSVSLLSGHSNVQFYAHGEYANRVPINIHPRVRSRLHKLLHEPELRGVGYSAFINRACEAAETEIANRRTENA